MKWAAGLYVLTPAGKGVIDVNGPGQLVEQFLRTWGCHIAAFISSKNKRAEIFEFGTHQMPDSTDTAHWGQQLEIRFDFIFSTVHVALKYLYRDLAPQRSSVFCRSEIGRIRYWRFSTDSGTAQHFRFASRQPGYHSHHAEFCRATSYKSHN
ncbi:hypothetical protein [Nitrosomonas aestuarii]|uniref:hypothetical protein n=1 Tax=Nitrosomonas aestuarii TaxID=52441 RepID=UPI000D4573C9|nr:hypothetical protein [Nitrosomonas aestuarii]PTN12831.1 hypothetical protein C8R11_102106 [Nitrosomonas aestuarii]